MLVLKSHNGHHTSVSPITGHWMLPFIVENNGEIYVRPYHCDGDQSPLLTDEELIELYSNRRDCTIVDMDVRQAHWTPTGGWVGWNDET